MKDEDASVRIIHSMADGWIGDLMRKEADRLRSTARLTETQQAAKRSIGENNG